MSNQPPILFIHGLFSRPSFMQPWVDRFQANGYECRTVTLPGRDPYDPEVLRRATLDDYFDAVSSAHAELTEPPVVIGHSLGGLLGQKLAAARECSGLVLLASVPPGVLWAQAVALPHLVRLMPSIITGRAVLPSESTMRNVPLSTLDRNEQDRILPRLVPDSARVFRSLLLGSRSTRVPRDAVTCPVLCVSGGQDRNVSTRASNKLAERYGCTHRAHPTAPHWIIADSLIDDVLPDVLDWVRALR